MKTATELVAAFAAREVSPVDVVRAALGTIERADDTINAFCLIDSERALADARASEQRWGRGEPVGRLDGVPVAIKDVFLTRGWPTRRGSRAIAPNGPWEHDAPAVAALRRHGAVLVGKTTTPELGWKGVTDSPLQGITRNPWDIERTSGGSSGGSSAALAAGMVPLALGTDGGGSIRIPCAMCSVVGLKPTYGRVPAWPASPYGTVAHCGPMARTVTDTALLLDVIAEPDARDWAALPPPAERFVDALQGGIAGLRVAFSPDLGHVAVDAGVAGAVARAARAFEELGAHVEQVDPALGDPREAFEVLWSAGAARAIADLGDPPPDVLDPGLADMAAAGRAHTVLDYLAAVQARDAFAIRMSGFFERFDLLLTPALPLTAFAAGREVPDGWPEQRWPSWTPFTYPFNLTQQPAAAVPCGFAAGLPVGLQIVGRRHDDALVLRAARAYEEAHPQPTLAPMTKGTDGWPDTSR